jgi:hypothetical protein
VWGAPVCGYYDAGRPALHSLFDLMPNERYSQGAVRGRWPALLQKQDDRTVFLSFPCVVEIIFH